MRSVPLRLARLCALVTVLLAAAAIPASGRAGFFGSTGSLTLNQPIVGMAPTPTGDGYWLVAADGGIFAFGDAEFLGSAADAGAEALGIVPTASGEGYWIAGADGVARAFGDAGTLAGSGAPNGVVAGIAPRPQGDGYWVATTTGIVAAEGAASDLGDLADVTLNQPIVGIASTPTGDGYWLVASDGGVFAFGDAAFFGSTGSLTLNQPIVGMASTPTGDGYWLVASDGGIFAFPTDGLPAPTAGPSLGGCEVFPGDNPWNVSVVDNDVHPDSATWIARLGADRNAHPDFGANFGGGPFGIPFVIVDDSQPDVPITFTAYGDESDPGPYPVPLDAPVEGGSDRHVLVLDSEACTLYELFAAEQVGAGWEAASGAVFDLGSNALRPLGWTSADAAGLPILPGLVRYDEVAAGSIDHALRVTFACTQRGYILPATHQAGIDDTSCPPMGARLRLRADVDLSGYTGQSLVVMEALKEYGAFVADNGSSFYFSGAPDARWSDDDLNQIKTLRGSDFEFVDTGPIRS